MQGWFRGCVEGGTLRPGCRSKRTYSNSDLQKVFGVGSGCGPFPCIDALTESCIEILQGGGYVENPSASQCVASDRSDDDGGSLCDGVGVDGKREYQRLREGKSGSKSAQACTFSIPSLVVIISLTVV